MWLLSASSVTFRKRPPTLSRNLRHITPLSPNCSTSPVLYENKGSSHYSFDITTGLRALHLDPGIARVLGDTLLVVELEGARWEKVSSISVSEMVG